ncbi:MAG: DeoR family transcriptional regulator [Parcubacteria group bacterium]|nr:DeoR family transcriptional regulator [Parcubacteria group bacterium]
MEKSYFIKLTVVLYRITELFPKEEPLRFSLRKKANDILADATLVFGTNSVVLVRAEKQRLLNRIIKNIDIIQAFFELAGEQEWIKQENFLVLQREYERVAKEAQLSLVTNKEPAQTAQTKVAKNTQQIKPQETVFGETEPKTEEHLKQRHKKILKLLKTKGVVQVKDVKDILPEVTKRTLRRDFDFLLKQGLVGRRGDKNKTEYVAR